MREKSTKKEFIAHCEKRIAMCNELKKFYDEAFLPTLKKFDGKVYNIRFIKALREEAQKINELLYVKELSGDTIEVEIMSRKFAYTDKETLYIHFPLTDEGRMSYDLVVNHPTHISWLACNDINIKEYQHSIENYDEYKAMADELEAIVEKYNNLPFPFRRNMSTDYLRIY